MKFKNEEGEEFEAFTKEELEAETKKAAEAALEAFKKENPPKEEKPPAQNPADDPVSKLTKQVNDLHASLRERDIRDMAKTYAGADPAKQKEYRDAFGRLTGYADTPEGLAEQAVAAARLIGIDPKTVNVGDVAGTGGNRNIDGGNAPKPTETDAVVQKALGISADDAKKYGPESEAGKAEAARTGVK